MSITDSAPGQLEFPRTPADVIAVARRIGAAAAPHAARHDREASFVEEGYEAIRAHGYGVIAVPRELGGGGHDLATVCRAQAVLAGYCASTSLAIAMHQHLVLSLAWRWRLGDSSVERTLRRIASEDLILSNSGSADPANPGVTAIPVEGGLLVTGRKRLVSGAPGADVVMTMARVEDRGRQQTVTVLIPTSDHRTEILPDWDAMGMRGSGSNAVSFTGVFVPEVNVLYFEPLRSLRDLAEPGATTGEAGDQSDAPSETQPDATRRPGMQIALTVIAAVYLGAAGAMRNRALRLTAARRAGDPVQQRIAGLLTHEFRSAWWALNALIAATTDESLGTEDHFITTMLSKRQVTLSSIRIVELAMELLGSRSYMRELPFEQALRDVRAGITHPLPPEQTLLEVGKSALESARGG